MARSNLSRHGELRYEYLLNDLEYLSAHEKQKFDYLYNKKQASEVGEPPHSQPSSAYNDNYHGDYYDDAYDNQVDYYDDDNWTSQGLPKYPKEKKQSKCSFRGTGGQQAEILPTYQDNYEDYNGTFYREPEPVTPKRAKKPKKKCHKIRIKRLLKLLGFLVILIMAGMIYMFFKGVNSVSSGEANYTATVTGTLNGEDSDNDTNILILGSDQRITQGSSNVRTNTIIVMNIGNSDGKIKLVSFMRDTLIDIDGVSYNAYSNDQKLSATFNIGEQGDNQGAELIRQTLKDNFDINIKYYVMIDFGTFAEATDTLFLSGAEIDARSGTVNGQAVSSAEVPDGLNMQIGGTVPDQTIEVGARKMNGRTLLSYTRFCKDNDSDYGRTQRQQQVISAIINQIKDPSKLFTGSVAIGRIYALTSTNISYSFLLKEGLSIITSGQEDIKQTTIPAEGDRTDGYDMYGSLEIVINFDRYQKELKELGLR